MIPSEITTLLFTKRQVKKLKVINLLKKGAISVEVIKDTLQISSRNAKLLMEQFMNELNEYAPILKTNTHLVYDGTFYFFKGTDLYKDIIELTDFLKYTYAKESPVYNLLLFTLEKRKFYIYDVANLLIYSESHSYKILERLNDVFDVLNLGIHLSKENGGLYKLIGKEATIRLLHYFSIIRVFRGENWPFLEIKVTEIVSTQEFLNYSRYSRLSRNNQEKFNYLIAIYENALKKGYKLNNLNDEVIEIGNFINKNRKSVYLKIFLENDLKSKSAFENEFISLSFVATYLIQELQLNAEKVEIAQGLHSIKNNSIVESTIELVNTIIKEYPIGENQHFELIYGICCRIVIIHHLGYFKFMQYSFIPEFRGESEQHVQAIINQTLKKLNNEESYPYLKFNLLQFIMGYVASNIDIKQRVYLEFFYRPEYKSIFENFLKRIYNNDIIEIVEDYYSADIIVSDSKPLNDNGKQYFYIDNLYDKKTWNELGKFLNNSINNNIVKKAKLTNW